MGVRPQFSRSAYHGAMRHLTPTLLLLCVSCSYQFPRAEGVTPGEVRGHALRVDVDMGASYARVAMNGSNVVRRALGDGTFMVRGLRPGPLALRLEDDVDGDGWPERGGFAAALLAPNQSSETSFVLLGDVALTGAMLVRGTVTMASGGAPANSGFVARAYITRGLCFDLDNPSHAAIAFSACQLDADRVEAGSEAVTAADDVGAFQFDGVVPGDVEVTVVLYQDDGGEVGAALAVQGPFRVSGDAAIDPPVIAAVFPTPTALPTRPVQVASTPAASTSSIAVLSEPGHPVTCASAPSVDGLRAFALGDGEVQLDVPLGIWDLTVCDGEREGRAFAQVATAPLDDEIPRWRVTLFEGDTCTRALGTDELDCDDDGLVQLPLLADDSSAEVIALWTECASSCAALGEALGDATCRASFDGAEQTFDCDDDADGQGDTTEVAGCIGPGRGTDLDGDRLCSTVDPFPQCAANEAAACPAGINNVTPVVVAGVPPRPLPQCGEAVPLIGAYNGIRDLEVIGDQLYVLGSSGVDRFPLDANSGVAAAGAQTVQNLVNFEEMGQLLLDGSTLFAAGGLIQPNPETEPSRLWVTNVAVPATPATVQVDLATASEDPEFLIAELDGASISSRLVAAGGTTVYVLEHTTGGDVIALDRASLASGSPVDVVATVDFALPIDARSALVIGDQLAILSANGDVAGGASVIFLALPTLDRRVELPLAPGRLGGMAVSGTSLFVGNAGAVRGFDVSGSPVPLALPDAFTDFHPGAEVHGLTLLDASTLLVGSSTTEGETRLTLFNLATLAPVSFVALVDQAGFGVSATDELAVLGGRFVYPTGRASAAPQQVVDIADCPRD